jgi:DNA replication and repair protein RecF
LIDYNETISGKRNTILQQLSKIISTELDSLIETKNLEVIYEPGWNTDSTLKEIYENNRKKELRYGYSLFGTQKDNINILIDGEPAQQILSRGQTKKLTIALILAQVILVKKETNKQIILLIDDVHSELDKDSVKLLLDKLTDLSIQVIITAIMPERYLFKRHQEVKVFHVEHGMIKPVKNL